MVQLLGGLITYLLLAIYCHEQYNERVSIKRVREIRIKIQNEALGLLEAIPKKKKKTSNSNFSKSQLSFNLYAKTPSVPTLLINYGIR
jgi:hypothetical protein